MLLILTLIISTLVVINLTIDKAKELEVSSVQWGLIAGIFHFFILPISFIIFYEIFYTSLERSENIVNLLAILSSSTISFLAFKCIHQLMDWRANRHKERTDIIDDIDF